MARTNKEVVLGYYAEVINGKKIDRLGDFVSESSISHAPTYVGTGTKVDDFSGDKVMVLGTMPGSSAEGKLQAGDQIVWVSDGKDTWDTYEQLRGSSWGAGFAGSTLTVRVLRGGKTLDFHLTRGFIEGMSWSFAEIKVGLGYFLTKLCPDLKTTEIHMLAEGDLVSVLSNNTATFTNYNRKVVWDSFELFRIKDGKIVEYWSVDDNLSQQKQLGYRIEPPVV